MVFKLSQADKEILVLTFDIIEKTPSVDEAVKFVFVCVYSSHTEFQLTRLQDK